MQKQRLRRISVTAAFAVLGLVASVMVATPAHAALGCDYGSFKATTSGELTNGFLYVDLCLYSTSPRTVAQVNVYYTKNFGSMIYARFAWEFTNASGVPYGSRRWDQGIFTQTAGTTRYYKWRYAYPGLTAASTRCVHGVMVTYTSAGSPVATYVTRVNCW
jgi:hypothetical protein